MSHQHATRREHVGWRLPSHLERPAPYTRPPPSSQSRRRNLGEPTERVIAIAGLAARLLIALGAKARRWGTESDAHSLGAALGAYGALTPTGGEWAGRALIGVLLARRMWRARPRGWERARASRTAHATLQAAFYSTRHPPARVLHPVLGTRVGRNARHAALRAKRRQRAPFPPPPPKGPSAYENTRPTALISPPPPPPYPHSAYPSPSALVVMDGLRGALHLQPDSHSLALYAVFNHLRNNRARAKPSSRATPEPAPGATGGVQAAHPRRVHTASMQWACSACMQRVRSGYATCTQRTRRAHAVFTQCTGRVRAAYTRSARKVHAVCMRWAGSACTQRVRSGCATCTQCACEAHAACMQRTSQARAVYTWSTCYVHAVCVLWACRAYIACKQHLRRGHTEAAPRTRHRRTGRIGRALRVGLAALIGSVSAGPRPLGAATAQIAPGGPPVPPPGATARLPATWANALATFQEAPHQGTSEGDPDPTGPEAPRPSGPRGQASPLGGDLPKEKPAMHRLQLVSYNVGSIGGETDSTSMRVFLAALKASRYDVALVQEHKIPESRRQKKIKEAFNLGFLAVLSCNGRNAAKGGTGVFVRITPDLKTMEDIEPIHSLHGLDGGFTKAAFLWAGEKIEVASIYSPAKARPRERFLAKLARKQRTAKPPLGPNTVLGGDFNTVPDARIDLTFPPMSPADRKARMEAYDNKHSDTLEDLLTATGLEDLLRVRRGPQTRMVTRPGRAMQPTSSGNSPERQVSSRT